MKTDLKDTTFLIPIRIDTVIRLENIVAVTQFLLRNFDCRIMVLEAAPYNNGVLQKLLNKQIDYSFVEDSDGVFYRTKYLNQMTRKVQTPYLGIWDADVIIPKKQIVDSIEKLRSGKFDMAYPYGGIFLDVSDVIRNYYMKKKDISIFQKNTEKMYTVYGENMTGGAILVNTERYKKAGMENERFYGWGPEDLERYDRWRNFGYRIFRAKGYLFHLTHPRGKNSGIRSNMQANNTQRELHITQNSSREEIEQSINQ